MSNLVTLRPKPGDVVESVYHVECELASDASSVELGAVVPATGKRYLLRCWLHQGGAGPAAATQHFVRIANSVELFSEPGIVEVFGIGQTNGLFYEVTEWLEGRSLKLFLERRGAMSVREAISLLLPCLQGLAAAHAAGIAHGDLRPGNVFICQSTRFEPVRARLLNFHYGNWPQKPVLLAKRLIDDVSVAQYLSPEELQGRPADPRSDVYAIGVMLYVMIAGRSPFAADNLNELAVEILGGRATPLSQRAADVVPAIESLIGRAMALDPSKRFQNIAELVVELARVEGHASEALAKHAPPPQAYTWIKPASHDLSTSLFDFPVLGEEELAAERRAARNRSILHACVAVSFAVMFAAILFRMYEPTPEERRAAQRARMSSMREGSELTAANQLPLLDHPRPNGSALSDRGADVQGQPPAGVSGGKPAKAPDGRTRAAPRNQPAAQVVPVTSANASAPLPHAPPDSNPRAAAAPGPLPATEASTPGPMTPPVPGAVAPGMQPKGPTQPALRSQADALDRMRIE